MYFTAPLMDVHHHLSAQRPAGTKHHIVLYKERGAIKEEERNEKMVGRK